MLANGMGRNYAELASGGLFLLAFAGSSIAAGASGSLSPEKHLPTDTFSATIPAGGRTLSEPETGSHRGPLAVRVSVANPSGEQRVMKRLGDILMNPAGGTEIVMGNSSVVRAMLEAGVRVVASYPGSPTPEIAEAIAALPAGHPLYFQFSVNEKVATEVAFGASLNGHLACAFFKSVGLNVAADSFVQLAHMELLGGLVIVLGDDPGANSSQNEQDNRHLARLAYTPIFEPAGPAEVYTMFKEAARLSVEQRMPIILRLTTHVCHAKERVSFAPWQRQPADDTPRFDPRNGPYIPITAAVFPMKRRALERLAAVADYGETAPLHRLDDHGNRRRGILTWGLPYLSALDALAPADDPPDVLKLGMVYPLPRRRIADFLRAHEEVKIIEELDDIVEREVKALAYDLGLTTRIRGKLDADDWMGEYSADKVAGILRKTWPDLLPEPVRRAGAPPAIGPRPPQMCPGCGHRSAFHAIKQALRPADISVADIGCHTLGFLEPYQVGQALLCMGHSNGTAAGLSLFNKTRRVVAFLGDSTFFHAGLPGIINAIFNGHTHTLIIMENGTTAMTGHQDHPGVGRNFNGPAPAISIRKVLEALGVTSIREVDTYQQATLRQAVEDALAEDQFSVVIARHPCMLKFTREARRKGRPLPAPVRVSEACNRRHVCVSQFACPSYQLAPDGSVWVQNDLCIGDGSCKQTCPSRAIVSTTAQKEA
jgi:indolepyruvate ferredoxin oxidoreductase alpha subunit